MKRNNFVNAILTAWLFILFGAFTAFPQTTEFSYQGFLSDNSASANGNFDFQFRLFDVATGGTALGTIQRPNVAVTNGVFNVVLDFGAFPSANRFLEIAVRPNGTSVSTTLAPRSKILSTPFSTNAINATNSQNAVNAANAHNSNQLGGVNANQFVQTSDARLSDARVPLPNSGNYIRNTTAPQNNTNFNVSGDGTAGGTLTGNIVPAASQFNIGVARVLASPGSFNFFAGILAGQSNTTGSNNSFFGVNAGVFNSTASNNAFFGHDAGRNNTTGASNSYFGRNAGRDGNTGSDNAFFGNNAGQSNTNGDGNSFFGKGAGAGNTTADGNSFFGNLAGNANTIGEENSFFGFEAGRLTSTGNGNSFFGDEAGAINTTGEDNTFVGSNAGKTNTTGERITLIGADADVGDADLSNAAAIGANAFVTTNNSMVLGSVSGFNGALFDTKVGIGTTAPLDRLHVGGIIRVETLGAAGSTSLCRNASFQISNCSSSLRYKTNIAPFSSGLNLVNQLKPISFDWKSGGKRDLGLGAEDVAAVEPLLVTYNESGAVEGVKYDRVAIVLLNAVKKQQAQIEQQKAELQAQKSRIEKLEQMLQMHTMEQVKKP